MPQYLVAVRMEANCHMALGFVLIRSRHCVAITETTLMHMACICRVMSRRLVAAMLAAIVPLAISIAHTMVVILCADYSPRFRRRAAASQVWFSMGSGLGPDLGGNGSGVFHCEQPTVARCRQNSTHGDVK